MGTYDLQYDELLEKLTLRLAKNPFFIQMYLLGNYKTSNSVK